MAHSCDNSEYDVGFKNKFLKRERLLKGCSDLIIFENEKGVLTSTALDARFGFKGEEGAFVYMEIRISDEGDYPEEWEKMNINAKLRLDENKNVYIEGNLDRHLFESHQLKNMKLRLGRNRIRYVTMKHNKPVFVSTGAFLYNHNNINNNLVISDIDGTITKSDFPGILPFIEEHWIQNDCIKLYHTISKHNYIFIYLTARPLGYYKGTKDFVKKVKESELHLPEGPVILNCRGATYSVALAEKFKGDFLSDLKYRVFSGCNDVIRASFGNADSDVKASEIANINDDRIFKARFSQRLAVMFNKEEHKLFTNYGSLLECIHDVFPRKMVTKIEERRNPVKKDWTTSIRLVHVV